MRARKAPFWKRVVAAILLLRGPVVAEDPVERLTGPAADVGSSTIPPALPPVDRSSILAAPGPYLMQLASPAVISCEAVTSVSCWSLHVTFSFSQIPYEALA
jgi:hypothetical protein